MKILAIIFSLVFLGSSPEWVKDLEQAKVVAKENNKLILLNFSGSDWCAPCIKLKKDVFESATFLQFAEQQLELVNADFPRLKKNQITAEQKNKNEKLAELYNPKGVFPMTLLLDAEGKVLAKWEGIPSKTVEDFVSILKSDLPTEPISK